MPRFSAVPERSEGSLEPYYARGRHGDLQADRRVLDYIRGLFQVDSIAKLGRVRRVTPPAGRIEMADLFASDQEATGTVQTDRAGPGELVVESTDTGEPVNRLKLTEPYEPAPFVLRLREGIYRATLIVDDEHVDRADFAVIDPSGELL